MKNRVEPPILMSRLMTFVFATAMVVLATLGITLYKMFPLNRPQVFLLNTNLEHKLAVTLNDMAPADTTLNQYKYAFIREYIKARNEITPNIAETRAKWANSPSAPVRAWSSDAVFGDFLRTNMWTALMNDVPDFEFKCPVNFDSGAIRDYGFDPRTNTNTYTVKFRQFCENNNGQVEAKDYTITLELKAEMGTDTDWQARLNNPLGLKVVKYAVESVDGNKSDKTDPLNRWG